MEFQKIIKDSILYLNNFIDPFIKKKNITENLIKLKGEIKAIKRTSGGLSIAQVIRVINKNGEKLAEVRFKDLSTNYQTKYYSKILNVDKLLSPFEFKIENGGVFAVDFGKGLFPVHVFLFEEENNILKWAYFIEYIYAEKGAKKPIKIYRIDPFVLRFVSKENDPVEFENIINRYNKLKEANKRLIPKEFIFGNPVEVPNDIDRKTLNNYLDALIDNKTEINEHTLPLGTIKEYFIDDKLIPFGVFEVSTNK